ncbi:MAG: carboxylate-amine ligase [Rhodospirillales bacterium]|jgi:carboxylate-amine ligase|nr:carboxylate-amine ligase [Rhodospirillales bacterium]MDP6883583.1 carboxylate-amine ligase [Rhodospirillales bacterium]
MTVSEPPFTIGIEEEYLLVDSESRDLASEPPDAVLRECESRLGDLVRPEFLRSQIEVGTKVCSDVQEARANLADLRRTVAEVAADYGLAPIAASTHPFAKWHEQAQTDKERYNILAESMQGVARRLLICGMHVHVGIDDDELRIDLLNQVGYFLPHMLALSTSSPFWRGQDTGLKSYRLSVFNELPRTGLPERFESHGEYQRHVDVLTHAGLITDASMLWWDARLSARFPTIEMRIPDICTRLGDAISIAALFVSIVRMLYRLRRDNQRWRHYAAMLVNENRWRAQRYGFDEGLVDFGKGEVVPCGELLEELFDLVREDAEALGCLEEVESTRAIIRRGTSAHRQLKTYEEAVGAGADHQAALIAVVDMLIAETVADL